MDQEQTRQTLTPPSLNWPKLHDKWRMLSDVYQRGKDCIWETTGQSLPGGKAVGWTLNCVKSSIPFIPHFTTLHLNLNIFLHSLTLGCFLYRPNISFYIFFLEESMLIGEFVFCFLQVFHIIFCWLESSHLLIVCIMKWILFSMSYLFINTLINVDICIHMVVFSYKSGRGSIIQA